jgi:hypothetical protein
MDYQPSSIQVTPRDLDRARTLIASDENYIVRYLREKPTVGLALVPVRNAAGGIVEDAPWVKRRVICSGVPYACMIALMVDDKLRIGWSRRYDEKRLIETKDLHAMYRQILADSSISDSVSKDRIVTEDDEEYAKKFDLFCATLMSVLSYNPVKDVEDSFSKDAGRTNAALRALLDEITIYGKNLRSRESGAIPNDIARNLPWFIKQAEAKFGDKAVNVF